MLNTQVGKDYLYNKKKINYFSLPCIFNLSTEIPPEKKIRRFKRKYCRCMCEREKEMKQEEIILNRNKQTLDFVREYCLVRDCSICPLLYYCEGGE